MAKPRMLAKRAASAHVSASRWRQTRRTRIDKGRQAEPSSALLETVGGREPLTPLAQWPLRLDHPLETSVQLSDASLTASLAANSELLP